jgi:hypothetical protein
MANLLGSILNPVQNRPNSFSTVNNLVGNPNQFGNFNLPTQAPLLGQVPSLTQTPAATPMQAPLGQGLLGQVPPQAPVQAPPQAPVQAPQDAPQAPQDAPQAQGYFNLSDFDNPNFMSFLVHNMPMTGKGQPRLSPLDQNAWDLVAKISGDRGRTGNIINQTQKQTIVNYLNKNFDPYAALMP